MMTEHVDELGLPIGFPVPDWQRPPRPPRTPMVGTYCRVEPLDADRHAAELHAANRTDTENRIWAYLPYGPFETLDAYRAWMARDALGDDPMFHAIIDAETGTAGGVASLMRVQPAVGSIEVGHINFAPTLQNTRAATEAMFLMMKRAFDELGYRRYEWKCDALNARSRRAAERLGFRPEGLFRQAAIYKGRNRDTAWYAILDTEWPDLKRAFESWLDADNFAADGRQKQGLSSLTGSLASRPSDR